MRTSKLKNNLSNQHLTIDSRGKINQKLECFTEYFALMLVSAKMISMHEPLTLKDCCARLAKDLGQGAPAMITLRRWAASGALDTAKRIRGDRQRPLWDYGAVLKVARARLPSLQVKAATNVRTKHPSLDVDAVADRVAALLLPRLLAARPAAGADQIPQALQNALDDLESTRRSLMVKYDQVLASQTARIDALLAAGSMGGRSSGSQDLSVELARIHRTLSDILARLPALG